MLHFVLVYCLFLQAPVSLIASVIFALVIRVFMVDAIIKVLIIELFIFTVLFPGPYVEPHDHIPIEYQVLNVFIK